MGNDESTQPVSSTTKDESVWYKSEEFCKAVQRFHDRYAQEPKEEMEQARQVHESYINAINTKLKADKMSYRIEFTGSSYEGVKVSKLDDDDLEFDVMMIMDAGNTDFDVQPIIHRPGFVQLRRTVVFQSFGYYETTDDGDYLSPKKILNKFHGILQKYANANVEMKGKVLRYHGPAIQMDAYHKAEDIRQKSNKFYSVDIVPTYEIGPDKKLYVAKPEAGECTASAWRRSFSLDEKNKFRDMDSDGGCRKQVLRVLKVIRNQNAELKSLTSFHLKMAFFAEVDDRHDWPPNKLGERLIDLIRKLQTYFSKRYLPHYYMPHVNLLSRMKDATIDLICNRLKILCERQKVWISILNINEEEESEEEMETSNFSGAALAAGLAVGIGLAIGGAVAYHMTKDKKKSPDNKIAIDPAQPVHK